MNRALAILIVRLAAWLLPAAMRGWGQAMEAEVRVIARPFAAVTFALGCFGAALRQRAFHLPSFSARPAGAGADPPALGESDDMPLGNSLFHRPRQLGLVCALAATGLGLCYMAAGGAPARYLAMNCAALGLGLLLLGLATRAAPLGARAAGSLALALAAVLLGTALFGISAGSATRWIAIGGVLLQPSLLLLPVLVLRFAWAPSAAATLAILLAALALALQPDRAMAGALAAATVVLALVRPERNHFIAAAGATAAFAATIVQADPSPAMPFVDGILYRAFYVHLFAGLAVVSGLLLMLVPAAAGLARNDAGRPVHAAFGALWLGVILAAALGNYPTPLVGYGGSAILGYLLSLAVLPPRAGLAAADPAESVARAVAGEGPRRLRAAVAPAV